ncbi:GNAT family N-acetyltransferase [Thalassobellus sediminis]|uniref:GNAT family N-acetyltransferase n=1 Tax=Thalassobellus sediminis TaxID=3367753 RepID=UPI0037ABB73E
MAYLKKHLFLWTYITKGEIPECYKELAIQSKIYAIKNNINNSKKLPLVNTVSLFPKFISPKITCFDEYNLKTIKHYGFEGAGIYIDIEKNETIDTYMSSHFKTQLRKNIKRYINRLEKSFDIKYEYNFGNISQSKYDFLMTALKTMLTKRFEQKNMTNIFLKKWDEQIKGLHNSIIKKKASLFVIYDGEKPISISLNYHESNTIFFGHSGSFDIDYIKFGLGHLDNYLQLDWCLKNKYKFLDLGTGILDYKKKWCNTFYDFDYHLFYKKKSILAFIILSFEIFKIKIKNTIKLINPKGVISKIKKILNYKNDFKPNSVPNYNIETIQTQKINKTLLKEININTTEYQTLRLPIYNYLYTSQENIKDISVYKIENELQTFLVQGKKNTLKVIFNI